MAKPTKRRVQGGRTTPKGGPVKAPKAVDPTPSARYTPPIPREQKVSPPWVPVLMFTCLGLGMAVILTNYFGVLPGASNGSNWYLLLGLGLITAGFLVATRYH